MQALELTQNDRKDKEAFRKLLVIKSSMPLRAIKAGLLSLPLSNEIEFPLIIFPRRINFVPLHGMFYGTHR